MRTILNPYISFKGNARQAMEFYKSVFGGQLTSTTYKEGGMNQNPDEADSIMHSSLTTDSDITIMAADTPTDMEYSPGNNMSISLSGDDAEQITAHFESLSVGGNVHQPLVKAAWGDTFGMITDRFGVNWMINITAQTD